MSETLKPCPICDGPPHVDTEYRYVWCHDVDCRANCKIPIGMWQSLPRQSDAVREVVREMREMVRSNPTNCGPRYSSKEWSGMTADWADRLSTAAETSEDAERLAREMCNSALGNVDSYERRIVRDWASRVRRLGKAGTAPVCDECGKQMIGKPAMCPVHGAPQPSEDAERLAECECCGETARYCSEECASDSKPRLGKPGTVPGVVTVCWTPAALEHDKNVISAPTVYIPGDERIVNEAASGRFAHTVPVHGAPERKTVTPGVTEWGECNSCGSRPFRWGLINHEHRPGDQCPCCYLDDYDCDGVLQSLPVHGAPERGEDGVGWTLEDANRTIAMHMETIARLRKERDEARRDRLRMLDDLSESNRGWSNCEDARDAAIARAEKAETALRVVKTAFVDLEVPE